jgi:transcription-repair coupling factor (superfamily II helicase)
MGARDLSIINTPPPNRMPIVTELHGFNEEIIKEGIEYEVSRNGQVFFIHNRVENIKLIQAQISRICPNVKTAIVHGQMDGTHVENVMYDFIQGDYDVLLATTIIESGLDIPNANTIFINDAHHFGLSELHQLRGRVGRSNKKAFCYLLAPPLSTLTHEARRRLKAIEEFSELGSGFNIAMQDLDIRGSGNLLGGEQSGFIADVGFETYQRILNEAMAELREAEFKEPTAAEDKVMIPKKPDQKKQFVSDFQIDTDLEIMFPDEYISNISERIRLYKELNEIDSDDALITFEKKLIDRFGIIPPPAQALLDIVRIKWIAVRIGIEKILLKNNLLIAYFVSDPNSQFYHSSLFVSIMNFVNRKQKQMNMKQKASRLSLTINNISSVKGGIRVLSEILDAHDPPIPPKGGLVH